MEDSRGSKYPTKQSTKKGTKPSDVEIEEKRELEDKAEDSIQRDVNCWVPNVFTNMFGGSEGDNKDLDKERKYRERDLDVRHRDGDAGRDDDYQPTKPGKYAKGATIRKGATKKTAADSDQYIDYEEETPQKKQSDFKK